MKYTRVRSYYYGGSRNGKWTGCEHLYFGENMVKALERFHKDYPSHDGCTCIAEIVDSEDKKSREWFQMCLNCGVVD